MSNSFRRNFMNMNTRLIIAIVSLIFISFSLLSLVSYANAKESLTINDIFQSKKYTANHLGVHHWIRSGLAVVEKSKKYKKFFDIVLYNPANSEKKLLVKASQLIPKGEKNPLKIDDFSISNDGQKILIYTNSKKVWRRNTRGDYWIFDFKNNKLNKLGGNAKSSTLMFASFSPDCKNVAYVLDKNIWVENLDNWSIRKITQNYNKNTINGTSDWVYEEEFSLRKAYKWSPNGRYIAYWQFDTTGVPLFYLINYTDSLYPKLKVFPYPKAGQTNSKCRLGVFFLEEGYTVWFKLKGSLRNNYIPWMDWTRDSKHILFQRLNRKQNEDSLFIGNIRNGSTQLLLKEKDSAWVDVVKNIKCTGDRKHITWLSERNDWRQVYLLNLKNKQLKPLTKGLWDIIDLYWYDDTKSKLYFLASPTEPHRRYLYMVNTQKTFELHRLTPKCFRGFNTYEFSTNGKFAFHTFSSFDKPPMTEIISIPSHKTIVKLVTNASLKERLEKLNLQGVEFFKINIGTGIILNAWCIKPAGLINSKKYPVLFYVYGEPAGQTVIDKWGGKQYLWHRMLSSLGIAVISIDNQGTLAPKGRKWRKIIYRRVGILPSKEQALAAKKAFQKYKWIDRKRVGIWGWSGGGSMTLNAIFRYPEIYKCAMAVAPVPDMHLYDSVYQERYMDLPSENPQGYKKGSPINFAENLEGKLLLVHGTGDDNVHWQGTLKLINKLILYNKLFSIMVYPNRTHAISEGKNTRRHLFEVLTNFVVQNLLCHKDK